MLVNHIVYFLKMWIKALLAHAHTAHTAHTHTQRTQHTQHKDSEADNTAQIPKYPSQGSVQK